MKPDFMSVGSFGAPYLSARLLEDVYAWEIMVRQELFGKSWHHMVFFGRTEHKVLCYFHRIWGT